MNKQLVFIDDSAGMRLTYQVLASWAGFDVICYKSGEEALAQLEQQSQEPDLVITDLSMGGMDGIEVSKRIRSKFPNLRVAIAVGEFDQFRLVDVQLADVTGWFHKPVNVEGFKSTLNQLCN